MTMKMRFPARVGLTALGALAFALSLLSVTQSASISYAGAASPAGGNWQSVSVGDDLFENYDRASSGVDWAIDFVFLNNAEIDKVKFVMGWLDFDWTGGPMHSWVSDNGYWVLDEDKGIKEAFCYVWGDTNHMRLYADGDDMMYNIWWGNYVIASTHIDRNECQKYTGGDSYGWSELSEAVYATASRQIFGYYNVCEDCMWLYNPEPYRQEGNHYWLNDYATWVWYP
jgi:hypothetical protein